MSSEDKKPEEEASAGIPPAEQLPHPSPDDHAGERRHEREQRGADRRALEWPALDQRGGVAIAPEMAANRIQGTAAIRLVPLDDAWALRHLTIWPATS